MKRKKSYDKSVYRSLVLLTQFGINMIVPIALCCALGIYLDNGFGTSWITVLLFFMGAVAGGQNNYRMAKRIFGKDKEKDGTSTDTKNEKQNTP